MKDKQFVVFGLGRFGCSIATALAEAGYEVMAVDKLEDRVQEISTVVTQAVQADISEGETLKALGIRNFDVAIVAIGKDIQASIMTTLLLKEMGIPYVMAKASNESHQKVLEKLGADRIIQPEYEMGKRIATNIISGSIIDYIQLSKEHSIVEVSILTEWIGKSIREINIRAKYGVNIIAITRNGDINITPGPDFIIEKEDRLVVVGKNNDLQELDSKRHE